MTVEDLLVYGKTYIHKDHVKLLLADLLMLNPLELLNYLDMPVNEEKAELFKCEIKALKEGKPLQYVTKKVNFYGIVFSINEDVLIPRFETEELVESTINYANKYFTNPKILDLGCGSGVIGLTLKKKLPTSSITLVDISKKALEVSQTNASSLNLDVNFILSDMLETVNGKFDIIISNPPYIKTNEEIEDIVKNNEPHIALYGGTDGLLYYQKIFKNVEKHMHDKCLIALEIGSSQKEAVKELAFKYLTNIKIITKRDLSNRDRMLFIFKNIE